ncbi:MAG: N-acetylmuramic acid 6-phosphate etherase [Paracoccaceae bacterium]
MTEQRHADAVGLDTRPRLDAAAVLANGQVAAAQAVLHALPQICAGAAAMAGSIRADKTLYYAAAGSSGLMAAADALELGGTFSIPPSQIRILMAGGMPTGAEMPGDTEDATDGLADALAGAGRGDTMIAVSASGNTAYTLAAVDIARAAGACVIGIANNDGADLLAKADHAILLPTPPEVLSGSTRMGAGTAQKIALNMLSTLMAIELGHVHDGMMVNVRADNAKLRARAAGIVAAAAGVGEDVAQAALVRADGHVKTAVLLANGVADTETATALLMETGGHLRPALSQSTQ